MQIFKRGIFYVLARSLFCKYFIQYIDRLGLPENGWKGMK